ncbi:MAG: CpaD family pilus assembly protein [Hyphomicrobiales bacterium]|nr:CpaD family pilus assembly lipoprotein [Hyphomicrobiales bacterium]MDE2017503.1 CpaD family pilus assembly protein [Hyphomicrobiales bacterium]
MSKSNARIGLLKALAALGVVATAPALGGCGPDRVVPAPSVSPDFESRFPVTLANGRATLDVFPSGVGAMDQRTRAQVVEFARRYRALGRGPITLLAPRGYGRAAADAIRSSLAAGDAGASVVVREYRVLDPALAAPFRLSYLAYVARVPRRCGDFPQDLASGSTVDGWKNQSYWNFGCAERTALANQVDDPRDLFGPRASDPPDAAMRLRAFGKIRDGKDPGTEWWKANLTLSSVGN